jgi:hypothetical protein
LQEFKKSLVACVHLADFHFRIGLRYNVDISIFQQHSDDLFVLMESSKLDRRQKQRTSWAFEVEPAILILEVDLIAINHALS